jgi:nucleotidyltransferase/DNA polymerase involved in DNA repair
VEKLRGIGADAIAALKQGGLATLGQLQHIPKPVLVAAFGSSIGGRIWNLARGHETDEVVPYTVAAKEMVGSDLSA